MLASVQGYLELLSGQEGIVSKQRNLSNWDNVDRRLEISRDAILKFGRNEKECNLVFSDPAVSSIHCVFWAVLFEEDSLPMCYVKDCSLNGTYINGSVLRRNSAYLLNDNDIVELHDENQVSFRFIAKSRELGSSSLLKQLGLKDKVGQWRITSRIIGNGTFGHVLVSYKDNELDNTNRNQPSNWYPENYAVKIIKLKPKKLNKEAKILLKLSHPNIIKVHHTYCDEKFNLYIFQDLIPGGDLFSYLAKGDCLTAIPETESLIMVYQILQALKYLHDQGIVHRDLKLDNILLCSPEPCTRVVLADFGIAKDLSTAKARMHTVVGTPEYCAPEVGFKTDRNAYQCFSRAATLEQRGYDSKCDLWSLGVITHIMLTGISPFYGDGTERSIVQNSKIGKLNFTTKQWIAVADAAKNFVRKLLEIDVAKRLNCDQSLSHPWIEKHIDQLDKIYLKKILNVRDSGDFNKTTTSRLSDWKQKIPKNAAIDDIMLYRKRKQTEI